LKTNTLVWKILEKTFEKFQILGNFRKNLQKIPELRKFPEYSGIPKSAFVRKVEKSETR